MRQAGNTRLADHGENLNRANANTHRYEIGWTPLLVSLDRSAPNDLVRRSPARRSVNNQRTNFRRGSESPMRSAPMVRGHLSQSRPIALFRSRFDGFCGA